MDEVASGAKVAHALELVVSTMAFAWQLFHRRAPWHRPFSRASQRGQQVFHVGSRADRLQHVLRRNMLGRGIGVVGVVNSDVVPLRQRFIVVGVLRGEGQGAGPASLRAGSR